jgi:hypothetical protein
MKHSQKYYSKFKKGIYNPKNVEKYIGNSSPTFRSSYELKFFEMCDISPKIKKWGSETFAIPYISPFDNRKHLYYIDNFILMENGEKYLVEIKPYRQTIPPKESKRKKETTILHEKYYYGLNMAKWEAAKAFAKTKNWQFIILTEKELGIVKK